METAQTAAEGHDELDAGQGSEWSIKKYEPPNQSRTLLPAPLASTVSLIARSSSLYLQLGSFVGSLVLDGARVTTLTSLEIGRTVIESILNQAGRDVTTRSSGALGRTEAESILERSITALHKTVTAASFAASTGFYLSATALGSITDFSQQLLASLDGILGSTDTSRAISSIIVLIRREFQNPATGQEGEQVGVLDLLTGICGLALLQRWCERMPLLREEENNLEEAVWDVVTLDGLRVDVAESKDPAYLAASSLSSSPTAERSLQSTFGNELMLEKDDEVMLRSRIYNSIPDTASVSITSQTKTSKTVTIEITGAHIDGSLLPPDLNVIAEDQSYIRTVNDDGQPAIVPKSRITYTVEESHVTGTRVSAPRSITNELSTNDIAPWMEISKQASDVRSLDNARLLELDSASFSAYTTISDHTENDTRPENIANQKKSRQRATDNRNNEPNTRAARQSKDLAAPAKKHDVAPNTEKKSSIRQVLKRGPSGQLSSLWSEPKDKVTPSTSSSTKKRAILSTRIEQARNHVPAPKDSHHQPVGRTMPFVDDQNGTRSETMPVRIIQSQPVSPSRSRPASPTSFRAQLKTHSQQLQSKTHRNSLSVSKSADNIYRGPRDYAPSIFTLKTNASTTSLALTMHSQRSPFGTENGLATLKSTGQIDASFPSRHIVQNMTRFVRFASASYGASFLRVMGIAATGVTSKKEIDTNHHHEHHSFSNHTQLPPDTILLSSFVDPAGGADSSGQTGTGVPMVHFVSLDHDSKAVVLTCRGTLGFEDVLTDMTCDYDYLDYQGKDYPVHRGIHASARRLLSGAGSKVVATITAALEEFPEYGLVLCGHSLGGAVVALLAIMISQPSVSTESSAFVTADRVYARDGTYAGANNQETAWFNACQIPPGRPIHVYAYGPPATLSLSLRLATRGLITTIVNGQDVVPYLSLGVLHDMQAVSLAFKNDDSGAKGEVRARVWEGLKGNFTDRWYNQSSPNSNVMGEDDKWAYSALKALRASMLSMKLVPPGEVFRVESSAVLRRDAFVDRDGSGAFAKPATRSILYYVKDVEKRFGELRFGGSMLIDHTPGRYEASLNALARGVLG